VHQSSKDATWLDKAYASPSGVVYNSKSKTVYVAGTRPGNVADLWADVSEIPFSSTQNNPRYSRVAGYVKMGAKTLKGHSLGAAVVGQFMADHPHKEIQAHVYDWPSAHLWQHDTRITDTTHYMDPVSALDLTAKRSFGVPHSYRGR
jgi:hypothetical protein